MDGSDTDVAGGVRSRQGQGATVLSVIPGLTI